jgi:putative transposase
MNTCSSRLRSNHFGKGRPAEELCPQARSGAERTVLGSTRPHSRSRSSTGRDIRLARSGTFWTSGIRAATVASPGVLPWPRSTASFELPAPILCPVGNGSPTCLPKPVSKSSDTTFGTWDWFYAGRINPPRRKQRTARLVVDVPQASKLAVTRLNRNWGVVRVAMIGPVRFRWTRSLPGVSRDVPGRITGARLIKDSLGWRISFRVETPPTAAPTNRHPPIGVDRGIVHTMALSDGQELDMPPLLNNGELRRLRKLELQAARQRAARMPGAPMSRRERQVRDQIGALRARQARRREDWLHKKTTDLAKNHGLVVVEDLHVKNMVRSARGSVENPGRHVRAKAGINRSILGMAWGKTGRMLAYKCPQHGGELVMVPAAYSSQTCAVCGHVAKASRCRARFHCVACGQDVPADINAARVVLQRGLAARSGTAPGHGVAGRGAFADGRAAKRQPPDRRSDDRLCRVEAPVATTWGGCQEPMERNSCR